MHYIQQLSLKKNWSHSHWCKINHLNHGFSTFDKWWYLFVMYNTKSYKKLVTQGQICEIGVGYPNIMWFETLIQFLSSLHLVFYQEILSFSTLEKTHLLYSYGCSSKQCFSMNLSHALYCNWKYPLFLPWVKIIRSTCTKVGWHIIECII
jgi:hypothetical protein